MIKNKKRIILVVGPYRSGTSALTKGLSALGVLLTATPFYFPAHNTKGDWEDPEFQKFNNERLNNLSFSAKRSRRLSSITEEEVNFLCKQGFLEQASQLLSEKNFCFTTSRNEISRGFYLASFLEKSFQKARSACFFCDCS